MATTSFSGARPVTQPYNSRSHHQYNPSGTAYNTPINSVMSTPSTMSPASPRHPSAFPHMDTPNRQLRPPRTVMPTYIPAVLRPTERPSRHAPPTPPRSAQSSFDNLDGRGVSDFDRAMAGAVLGGHITRMVTDEWTEDGLGKVTGPPTRNHWKPDSAASHSDHATCSAAFTLLNRRHHCRRCGKVFCSDHSSHVVSLDQNALFHPDAGKTRSCDACWSDYKVWEKAKSSRASSASAETARPNDDGTLKVDNSTAEGVEVRASEAKKEPQKVGHMAGSVPAQWQWSTF